ncbi:DUF2865 domain-containing protein (plasmid) [Phyllobacterium sp. K27]
MTLLRNKAKSQGCGGLFPKGDISQCNRIKRDIGIATDKLSVLRRGEGVSSTSLRRPVLAALEAKGCNGRSGGERQAERPRSLLDVLFGKHEAPPVATRKAPVRAVHNTANAGPERINTTNEGTDPSLNALVKKGYRTVCVRMCDGYYFPISFSSKSSQFGRDQKVCSAMCPGAEAKLYFHKVPDEESDAMISVADNKPYAELSHAFNYRNLGANAVPGCSCDQALTYRPNAIDQWIDAKEEGDTVEETALSDQVAMGSAAPSLVITKDFRAVRMVGPAFLPEGDVIDFEKPRSNLEPPPHSGIITPENFVNVIVTDIRKRLQ